MVHVSEISHARINHPSEILKLDQKVKVKVMKIEQDKGGRQRIALSMKALEPDTWEKGLAFQEGEIISGKVSRLMEFGAFIEVAPGVDGLVHVSEISYDRISHPSALLHEGDIVDVRVRAIDYENHRISLSIKDATIKKRMKEHDEGPDQVRLEVGQILRGIVENIKPYGLFVRLPQIGIEVRGLLPIEELVDPGKTDLKKKFPKGKEIRVEIISIDEEGRIRLSQKAIADREDREDYEKFLQKEDKAGKLGTLGDIFKNLKL
jgi:small subunit ribosomal protein S1